MTKKRARVESMECPNCGGSLEPEEEVGNRITKCPWCRSTVQLTVEDSEHGGPSKDVPYFPTKGFGKTPREYEPATTRYDDLKHRLERIDRIKGVKDFKEIKETFYSLRKFSHDYIETIDGQPDYRKITYDISRISGYLQKAANYKEYGKRLSNEALKSAKRCKESLLEKITKREHQLKQYKMDYVSRLKKYSRVVVVIGIIVGLFFLSNNSTGNSILDLSKSMNNWIGWFLFLIGLIGAFLWIKEREQTPPF